MIMTLPATLITLLQGVVFKAKIGLVKSPKKKYQEDNRKRQNNSLWSLCGLNIINNLIIVLFWKKTHNSQDLILVSGTQS